MKLTKKYKYTKLDKNAENSAYWECARDFSLETDKFNVSNHEELLTKYKGGTLRRKVEVTLEDELKEFFSDCEALAPMHAWHLSFYELVDTITKHGPCIMRKEFIEMCHLVASMTDKPE